MPSLSQGSESFQIARDKPQDSFPFKIGIPLFSLSLYLKEERPKILGHLHITASAAAWPWKPMPRSSCCTVFVLMLMPEEVCLQLLSQLQLSMCLNTH